MLEVRHLVKRYGRLLALDDVALDVADGTVCGVVGRNGAGKTTLLRIVAGYMPPTAGRVIIGGVDISRDPIVARRRIGYLPEGSPLPGDLRVDEYLRYRGQLKGLSGRRLRGRQRQVIEQFDLGRVQRRLISRLSLGMRRRVGLADAVLHEPRLMVLDDPFAGLDGLQVEETCRLLAALPQHSAVLLATHRLDLVERLCRQCVVLEEGRRIEPAAHAGEREVVVEVHGCEGLSAQQALAAVAGVSAVSATRLPDGWWTVRCSGGPADLRPAVAAAVAAAGWRLRALQSPAATLTATLHATWAAAAAAERKDAGPPP